LKGLLACGATLLQVASTLLLMLSSAAAQSQSQAASVDQIQAALGGLSPEQQQLLLQQLGSGSGDSPPAVPAASGVSGAGQASSNGSGLQDVRSRDAARRTTPSDGTQYARDGSPLLKALDTVLITVSLESPKSSVRQDQSANAAARAPGAAGSAPGGAASSIGAGVNGGSMNGGQGSDASPQSPPRTDMEVKQANALIQLLRSRNPYTLDRTGALNLPGFAPIPLAGLTEGLATKRLAAEPALSSLYLNLTLLPLTPTGSLALRPYGYDLFSGATSFSGSLDVPVPDSYVVGAGDEFSVQLFGSQNRSLRLKVDRDGRIAFPELGPIPVGGRRFRDVQADLEARINRQMTGVHGSVSMGTPRSIGIFVVGEVNTPGSYSVSGLSTITGALFSSGGVKPIGTLRDIQLKRAGQVVQHLDLYDLLMNGDTSSDVHLLPGDVIFVPPVGATVTVEGEVRRPAIYELKGTNSVSDAIAMAGGFGTEADTEKAELTRIDQLQRRIVLEVGLASRSSNEFLKNGDVLQVARLRPTIDAGIQVQGDVYHPGIFAWHENIRLADVISSINELKTGADAHYLAVRREQAPDRHIIVLSADLTAALRAPESSANILLAPRDQITIFDTEAGRAQLIRPLLDELKLQSNQSAPAQVVSVTGRVRAAGDYPLEPGMKVSDLVRAGGSLDDAAYGGVAELSRYVIENGQARRTQLISIDLAAAMRGDPSADLALQPADGLYIKEISGWSSQDQVTLRGEVRFPGTYPIKRGESLRSVIDRAGGLTDLAFVEGSVFTRELLRQREQQEIDRLTDRMQNELVMVSLMEARGNQPGAAQTFSVGQSLLGQLKAARAVGRLVINLADAINASAGSANDVVLMNGDTLVIPRQSQEVTVIGEVQNVTSHFFKPGLTRDDYIRLSGGMTRMADSRHTYVVRANGSVVAGTGRWTRAGASIAIRPGDTIVVPLDAERQPALPLWLSVTTILYNIAIAVAAVHTL